MSDELKKEDVQKDLEGLVKSKKDGIEKEKEANLPPEEKAKVEADKKAAQEERIAAEAQAKKDAELIAKKEEDCSEDEKKQRQVLLDKQTEQEKKDKEKEESKLSSDEKIQRVKESTQKRIDELSNELKQAKDKGSKDTEETQKQLKILQAEKKALEERLAKPPEDKPDIEAEIEKQQGELIEKHLKDDKALPREKRREMTKEELDEWYLENPVDAQTWITRRELRRNTEYQDIAYKQTQKVKVKELMDKQGESTKRSWIKHPELDITKRTAELKAEGKSAKEIHEALCAENPKHKLVCEIIAEDPRKYTYAPNGPELLVEEMEKRLAKPAAPAVNEEQKKEIDALNKRIEELEAQQQKDELNDEGIGDGKKKKPPAPGEYTAKEKQFIKTSKEMGMPQARIDAKIKQMRESNSA